MKKEKGASSTYEDVMKWTVIAVAVAGMGVVTAVVQSDTYPKGEIDRRLDRIEQHHDTDVDRLYQGIEQIQRNVEWLVRERGGTPTSNEGDQ